MSDNPNPFFSRRNLAIALGFAALMLAYYLIYGQFFPARNGMMGHDWNLASYVPVSAKPALELFSWPVAAGNPASCNGGVALGLTNIPLTFEGWLGYFQVNPVDMVFANFLFIAAVGFWGMFLLLRASFSLGSAAAFLGAFLFLFNEFYATRIVIGHLYYPVMLVPMVVYFLTRRLQTPLGWMGEVAHGVVAGLVLFYAWSSGLLYVAVTVLLSMLSLSLLALIAGASLRSLLVRGAVALAIAISWSWLSLSQSLFSESLGIALSQRQSYSLQGFVSLWEGLKFLLVTLFYGPADIAERYSLAVTNLSVMQGQHELEFSIGPAALLLLLAAAGYGLKRWLNSDYFFNKPWWQRNALWLLLLAGVLLFPWLYNTYSPLTNELWKKLPLINSTTSPQRVYFVYTITLVVLAAQWVDRYLPGKALWPVTLATVVLTIGATSVKDRSYYQNQPYDTKPVIAAWQKVKAGADLPAVTEISILVDEQGRPIHNQMMEVNARLQGRQSMGCYVPAYSSAPVELVKQLHPGSVWDVKDGFFNIKNPACNTWPKENGCLPGDHFKLEQKAWVESYTHYKAFPVVVPERVIAAAWVSRSAMLLTLLFLAGFVVYRLRVIKRLQQEKGRDRDNH